MTDADVFLLSSIIRRQVRTSDRLLTPWHLLPQNHLACLLLLLVLHCGRVSLLVAGSPNLFSQAPLRNDGYLAQIRRVPICPMSNHGDVWRVSGTFGRRPIELFPTYSLPFVRVSNLEVLSKMPLNLGSPLRRFVRQLGRFTKPHRGVSGCTLREPSVQLMTCNWVWMVHSHRRDLKM
jgi:hypothetical protein